MGSRGDGPGTVPSRSRAQPIWVVQGSSSSRSGQYLMCAEQTPRPLLHSTTAGLACPISTETGKAPTPSYIHTHTHTLLKRDQAELLSRLQPSEVIMSAMELELGQATSVSAVDYLPRTQGEGPGVSLHPIGQEAASKV